MATAAANSSYDDDLRPAFNTNIINNSLNCFRNFVEAFKGIVFVRYYNGRRAKVIIVYENVMQKNRMQIMSTGLFKVLQTIELK